MNTMHRELENLFAEPQKCVAWANERYKAVSGVSKYDMVKAYLTEALVTSDGTKRAL